MPCNNNLKTIRETRKLTQNEVAAALNIKQRAVSKYENATRIYYDTLIMFSKYYKEPAEKLFECK